MKTIIKENNTWLKILSPFMKVAGMAIFPFIILKKDLRWIRKFVLNHEFIHIKQQKELFVIPFFIWYFIEFIIRIFIHKGFKTAYKNICFEREAYANMYNLEYLDTRKKFAFLKYL